MYTYNTDPIIELQRAHQKNAEQAAHLHYLTRILRRRRRKRVPATETIQVSCTIYPTEC